MLDLFNVTWTLIGCECFYCSSAGKTVLRVIHVVICTSVDFPILVLLKLQLLLYPWCELFLAHYTFESIDVKPATVCLELPGLNVGFQSVCRELTTEMLSIGFRKVEIWVIRYTFMLQYSFFFIVLKNIDFGWTKTFWLLEMILMGLDSGFPGRFHCWLVNQFGIKFLFRSRQGYK